MSGPDFAAPASLMLFAFKSLLLECFYSVHEAELYAVGAVVGKSVLLDPVFVVIVAANVS